jgi:hypothetical protein
MTLKVIGAGFGRTGTASMKIALETLGFGPCHHMLEVMKSPEQKRLWRAISGGLTPDWDEALAGYGSSVDWPSAFFWRELAERYPEAKVLLTLRSSESWLKSMEKTIFGVLDESTDPESVGLALIAQRVFSGNYRDREHAIAVYERNTADVQDAFGDDRLLTYNIGDGWEPLCRFLGKAVPDVPYPRTNSAAEFNTR